MDKVFDNEVLTSENSLSGMESYFSQFIPFLILHAHQLNICVDIMNKII